MSEFELRRSLDAVYRAQIASRPQAGPGAVPSLIESRDMLRLFSRIENEDVRHTILCLLRTLVARTDETVVDRSRPA